MLRPWMVLIAMLAVAGCKSSGSGSAGTATDPFFGRTRVEPPRTGMVRGQSLPNSSRSQTPAAGIAVRFQLYR